MSIWASDRRCCADEIDTAGCGDDPFYDVAHTRMGGRHVTRITIGNGQAFLTRAQAIAVFLSIGDHLSRGPLPGALDTEAAATRRSLRDLAKRLRSRKGS